MFDLYCRIIVMGSFAIALIMNFEKNKWKMLKKNLTLFWPRNKATFIQLPDAEKNEVSITIQNYSSNYFLLKRAIWPFSSRGCKKLDRQFFNFRAGLKCGRGSLLPNRIVRFGA